MKWVPSAGTGGADEEGYPGIRAGEREDVVVGGENGGVLVFHQDAGVGPIYFECIAVDEP